MKSGYKQYLKNDKLKTVKKDFPGNLFVNGAFKNLYGESGIAGPFDVLKWKFGKNPKKKIKNNEEYELKVFNNKEILNNKEDYICWLGHASFLIQINGKKIITDPCLTNPPFYKRFTKLPFEIENIKPDYICVSHGHLDHLDKNTIKYFDNSTALIPLNMSSLINKMNKNIKTIEASWYQKYNITEDFEIFLLPAHHWHRRTPWDKDKILWGSFLIKTRTQTIYFAGDTGYSKHFKDIYEIFGEIDITILPIGAYDPSWFMQSSHMNPKEALKAFSDLHAKEFIPMHFGTFDLSDEPLGEPEQILRKIGKEKNIRFLTIGEEYNI